MRRAVTAAMFVAAAAGVRAPARAQMQISPMDDPPRTAAYVELGGNAMFSGNIDVMVAPHTSIRVGGFVSPFDIGLEDSPWNALGVTSSVGYRIQSKRQFGRVVLTPSPPRANRGRRRAVLGLSYGVAL